MDILNEYLNSTGLFNLTLGNILFFILGFIFLFVAIVKKLEPYVLTICLKRCQNYRLTTSAHG